MGDVFMSAVILSSRASNTPKKFNHFFHGAGHNVQSVLQLDVFFGVFEAKTL